MPMVKKLIGAAVAFALLAGGPLPATAAKKKPVRKPVPAIAAEIPESSEIELLHQLPADKAEHLKALADRFNSGSLTKIVLKEGEWSGSTVPDMIVLEGEDEAKFLEGKPRYQPLHLVMRQAGEPLQTLKPPAMMTPAPLDATGKLIGLPIGLATAVMYINRDAFKKAGLNPDQPPKTWFELQQALGTLADQRMACPYATSQPAWVHVENISAWHNQPLAVAGVKREGPLAVNNLPMVKHLAMMISWHKSRYMHVFGRGDEADAKFASGECAVLTGRSSAFPSLKKAAKFDIGVAPLPYHDDIAGAPQNTLADGPVLWIGAGRKPQTYKVIAKFVSSMLAPEAQVEWQLNTGYLPLNRAGLMASESELLKSDLINVRTAVAELTNKPATAASKASRYMVRSGVRRILDEELEAIWEGRKPAKEALDNAVARSQRIL